MISKLHNRPKSKIMFDKKSPQQDFIKKTLLLILAHVLSL